MSASNVCHVADHSAKFSWLSLLPAYGRHHSHTLPHRPPTTEPSDAMYRLVTCHTTEAPGRRDDHIPYGGAWYLPAPVWQFIARRFMLCIDHSDQIEKSVMGAACSTYGGRRSVYRVVVGTPDGKRQLGRPRRRPGWERNVKMDLK